MSEEKFFSQVKSSLEFYEPQAPQEVYSNMRRKLWWSGFTKLSLTRFNMWYLILLVGIGGTALAYSNTCDAPAASGKVVPLAPTVAPAVSTTTEAIVPETILEPVVTTPVVPVQAAVSAPVTVKKTSASKTKSTKVDSTVSTKSDVKTELPSEIILSDTPPSESGKTEVAPEEAPKKKKKLTLDIYKSESSKD